MRTKAALFVVIAWVFAAQAHAITLTPFNTDDAGDIGDLIVEQRNPFLDVNGGVAGSLTSTVFFDGSGIYTYVYAVVPNVDFISEFNTGFAVGGLLADGTEVGFSFSGALANGGTGTAADFTIIQDPDGTIDWETNGGFLGIGDLQIFHIRSTFGPTKDTFNLINAQAGKAIGFGPVVPIPAAAWLLGSALLGLMGLRRRR